MKKLINKILSLFKKKRPPTLTDSWVKLNKLCEEFDNTVFYMKNIPGFEFNKVEFMYGDRASFNLASFRDEIRIRIETDFFTKRKEEYAKRAK